MAGTAPSTRNIFPVPPPGIKVSDPAPPVSCDDHSPVRVSLPPLPKTVIDMQRVCNDPESSIGDLVKTIEGDPMIVANLLKTAGKKCSFCRRS